jgi:hypothetical protein
MTCHDACQRQDLPGRLSIPRHCTLCCRTQRLEPCGITVNHLPLAYKRRTRSPSRRETIDNNSLAFPPSSTILALCLNQPSGTWRLLLSRIACISPLRAPWCLAIQHHKHTPAGRMTHGWTMMTARGGGTPMLSCRFPVRRARGGAHPEESPPRCPHRSGSQIRGLRC